MHNDSQINHVILAASRHIHVSIHRDGLSFLRLSAQSVQLPSSAVLLSKVVIIPSVVIVNPFTNILFPSSTKY